MTAVAPYFQPLGSTDCSYYAIAYLARCLGHADVTADQVKAWRAVTGLHEDRFLGVELRAERLGITYDEGDWWLGPTAQPWVTKYLDAGYIGLAVIHRIPTLGHAVAVLAASDWGVDLMDPWPVGGGLITEPWDAFLGPGPGHAGVTHRIACWYRAAKGS